MPTNEELQIEVDGFTELFRDSKEELEGATVKLGEVVDEKAVLFNRLKRKF